MNKKYIPLGCTVRELLLCCDPIIVAMKATLVDYKNKEYLTEKSANNFIRKQSAAYQSAITEIVTYDTIPFRPMGFVLRHVSSRNFGEFDWISIGLYNWKYIGPPPLNSNWKEHEKEEHVEIYSPTFSEWREHPDREILLDGGSFNFCHSLEDIAAELMWEITWGGFSGKL